MLVKEGDSWCSYGDKIRFELYSIVVECIDGDRNFKQITAVNNYKEECIYERDEEEDIPLGEPLSLFGPTRSCTIYDRVYILIGEWDWDFILRPKYRDGGVFDTPVTEYVKDPDSKSCAIICYERISNAVEAELEFKFDDITNSFEIVDGEISATTNNLPLTRRVLCAFGCHERSLIKKMKRRNDPFLEPDKPIPLDRSVLALPLEGELNVSVDITYCVVPPENNMTERSISREDGIKITRGTIKQSLSIKVPEYPQVSRVTFSDLDGCEFPKLNLEVNWPSEKIHTCYESPVSDDSD